MAKVLCEGGIEQNEGPCWKCGRTKEQRCGSPLPDPRDAEIERLRAKNTQLHDALTDMLSGWRYIREAHGDLYGVGWDRAQTKAEAALRGEGEQ